MPAPLVPTKTYTLLGVARGTAPTVRASTLEAPDLTVNSVPDLTRRVAIVVLATLAVMSLLAVFLRSPLEEAANALVTPNPAKAPWYFLWLQEIVTDTTLHIGSFTINGAFIGGVVLPGLLVTLLTVWPWLDRSPLAAAGVWFAEDAPPAERRLPRHRRRRHRVHADRHVLSRAVLAVLLAVADLAGHSDEAVRDAMEQRTNSPYPRLDRPVLAVIGIAARRRRGALHAQRSRARVALLPVRVQAARRPRSSAPTRRGSVPTGLQQIWVPSLGHADRCVTCHQATTWKGFETAEEPFRTHPVEPLKNHPIEKFGCTSCHGGQGWAVDAGPAHGPVEHWEEPLLGKELGAAYSLVDNKAALMQMNCNTCHRYDRETKGAEMINLAKQLVKDKGCRACHTINSRGGTIGPDLTFVGDKAPEQYDYGRLSGQKTAFAWHVAHLKDPRALVADTVMPNFNLTTKEVAGARDPDPVVAQVAGARRDGARHAAHRSAERRREGGRRGDEDRSRRVVREDRLLRVPLDLRRSA